MREAATICPRPYKLTFDLLTLKVVSESCVTWATSMPIIVFLGLSVLDLGPMYATDSRQTDVRRLRDVRRVSSLNVPCPRGGGIINRWRGPWPLASQNKQRFIRIYWIKRTIEYIWFMQGDSGKAEAVMLTRTGHARTRTRTWLTRTRTRTMTCSYLLQVAAKPTIAIKQQQWTQSESSQHMTVKPIILNK